jgi:hypothetical protein
MGEIERLGKTSTSARVPEKKFEIAALAPMYTDTSYTDA